MRRFEELISQFINGHRLPGSYRYMIDQHWLPLSDKLAGLVGKEPLLVGINGAQGTGKSTMADILALILGRRHGLRCEVISIDDMYLSRGERNELAESVHPLLKTRGVPGTHDIGLLLNTIRKFKHPDEYDLLSLPRFDKAEDERKPRDQWRVCSTAVDVILLEGWCVGTAAQSEHMLSEPINALETCEDPDMRWRCFVNETLAGSYQELNEMIDFLVMLKAPDFETVYEWRSLQESRLHDSNPDAQQLMDEVELLRFIQHYERLTRHNLKELPKLADALFCFDHSHDISSYSYKKQLKA